MAGEEAGVRTFALDVSRQLNLQPSHSQAGGVVFNGAASTSRTLTASRSSVEAAIVDEVGRVAWCPRTNAGAGESTVGSGQPVSADSLQAQLATQQRRTMKAAARARLRRRGRARIFVFRRCSPVPRPQLSRRPLRPPLPFRLSPYRRHLPAFSPLVRRSGRPFWVYVSFRSPLVCVSTLPVRLRAPPALCVRSALSVALHASLLFAFAALAAAFATRCGRCSGGFDRPVPAPAATVSV